MVEHVVGDDSVERAALAGDRLGVDDFKFELAPAPEVLAGLFQHPGGKIRQGDLPTGGNPAEIVQPQVPRAAAQLQYPGAGWQVEMVEDPWVPAVFVHAETLVELDARIQVRGILVLFFQVAPVIHHGVWHGGPPGCAGSPGRHISGRFHSRQSGARISVRQWRSARCP